MSTPYWMVESKPAFRKERMTQALKREVATRYGAERGSDTPIACHYCGEALLIQWRADNVVRFAAADGFMYACLDHYVPLSKGGKHESENIVAACDSCNLRKGAALPEHTP